MKVPQINTNRHCPQILLGTVDISLRGDVVERIFDFFRTRNRIERNSNQLQEYFSHFFAIPIHCDTSSLASGWIFNFSVKELRTFALGADDVLSFVIACAVNRPFVTVEGELLDAGTREVLAKQEFTERRFSPPICGGRIRSLPMIEIAAIKLLKNLKESALTTQVFPQGNRQV
jgi:hypothetical protein